MSENVRRDCHLFPHRPFGNAKHRNFPTFFDLLARQRNPNLDRDTYHCRQYGQQYCIADIPIPHIHHLHIMSANAIAATLHTQHADAQCSTHRPQQACTVNGLTPIKRGPEFSPSGPGPIFVSHSECRRHRLPQPSPARVGGRRQAQITHIRT